MMAIAWNTVQEHLHDKLFYNIAVFGLLMVRSSVLVSELTVGESARIVVDLGLGSMHLFSALIAIFLGIGLIGRELDRKTVQVVLAKPVPRYRLVLGKYAGLLVTLLVNLALLTALWLLVLVTAHVPVTRSLLLAVALIYAEMAVVVAAALLCSTFTTTTLGAIFTLAFFAIGHSGASLRLAAEKFGGRFTTGLVEATRLLPDLERFNLKGHALYGLPVSNVDVVLLLAYALAYSTGLLLVAASIF